MKSVAILLAISGMTIVGDYFIKLASARENGITSLNFLVGAALYATTAVGWLYLMQSHSLASIAVMYSASIILLLAALGYVVFNEPIGLREVVGLSLAITSVVVMSLGV